MKKVDIYIDLENVGLIQGMKRSPTWINWICGKMKTGLAALGYEIGRVVCFASYSRKMSKSIPVKQLAVVRERAAKLGWEMVWSNCIADEALDYRVKQDHQDSVISDTVMIMSNDSDFAELAYFLRGNGYYVIACGPAISKGLAEAVDHSVSMKEIIGSEDRKSRACKDKPFNPILLQ